VKLIFSIVLVSLLTAPVHASPDEMLVQSDIVMVERPHSDTVKHTLADMTASSIVQEIILQAMSLIGIPYKWGGNTPETGLDCSGFIRHVFQQSANVLLPRTARAMSQIGKAIHRDELQPGDLVFFNTLRRQFSHVGIYLGDDRFIHAPATGKTIRVTNMKHHYWTSRYNGARRVNRDISSPAVIDTTVENLSQASSYQKRPLKTKRVKKAAKNVKATPIAQATPPQKKAPSPAKRKKT
jgi:hypothetical protein